MEKRTETTLMGLNGDYMGFSGLRLRGLGAQGLGVQGLGVQGLGFRV